MLAKEHKLPIQLFVAKKGKIIKTPYFLLRVFIPETESSRFGVTVSVKTAKRATDRNKLKRLVYNFVKEYHKKIQTADYWITILQPAANLPKESLLKELNKLLITNH